CGAHVVESTAYTCLLQAVSVCREVPLTARGRPAEHSFCTRGANPMPRVRTTVGNVLSADLVHVEANDSVTTAAAMMGAAQVGSALVMEGDALRGIFTERDILRALKRNPHQVLDSPVGEWMTHDPRTVGPEVTVKEALRL